MRIVHLTTEFAPFAKAGGLGEVLVGLARELTRTGQNIEVILPKYDFIPPSSLNNLKIERNDFSCLENGAPYSNSMWSAKAEGCQLLLLDSHHPKNYFQRGVIYGCEDDTARFLYFSKACLEYLKARNEPIDILHLHDWPVAIAAVLAKDFYQLPIKAIVLSIHNADYQGLCATWDLDAIGIKGTDYLTSDKLQDDRYPNAINLLKGGIVYADAVNTVSPNYAQEILTPEIGHNLSSTFRKYKNKLCGILNGIDQTLWDPSNDPSIKVPFAKTSDFDEIERGKESARDLVRKRFGLTLNQRPWVGAITRLVPQKGPDLLEDGITQTMREKGSFLLLGSSPIPSLQEHFNSLKQHMNSNKNAVLHFEYNEVLAHQLYAALDFILVPSLFEPCGLTQLIAMRYGTIPIVRATGGLQDTVFDCENPKIPTEKKNGFVFQAATKKDLESTMQRAFDLYRKNPEIIQTMIKRGMQLNFGWEKPAQQYMKFYENCLKQN